jgi:hypothetical protein
MSNKTKRILLVSVAPPPSTRTLMHSAIAAPKCALAVLTALIVHRPQLP